MATVQKAISESGSLSTRTLVTTISAPGIKQDAEISVSPNIDSSKISYTINEAAGTVTVTLTNVGYTSTGEGSTTYYYNTGSSEDIEPGYGIKQTCYYENGQTLVNYYPGNEPVGSCQSYIPFTTHSYYFNYTVTITYKTFPEFAVRQNGQLKSSTDGWVRVNGQLRQIQQMWVRANGQLKEI